VVGASTQPGVPSLLRVLNDRSALELLLTDGAVTRAELGRRTGLSRVTASQALARLQARGLVQVVGSRSAGRGPNAELYAVCDDVGRVLGVDVRASGVGVSVSSVADETLASSWREATDGQNPIDLAIETIDEALGRAGVGIDDVLAAVVGVPGLVDPRNGDVGLSHDLAGAGAGVRAALEGALKMPVTLENDVNLAAIAEKELGAAADEADFVLVWIGAGVGMAVMVNGRLHRGATGAAGEIGYLPVPGVALPERVDQESEGAFQQLVGVPALAALADQHGLDVGRRDVAGVAGAVAYAAGGGNEAFLNELARRVALGVASVCAVLDPGLVVLSGETGLAGGAVLAEAVADHVERVAPVHPAVVVSAVGDRAVLNGANSRAVRAARRALLARLDDAADD